MQKQKKDSSVLPVCIIVLLLLSLATLVAILIRGCSTAQDALDYVEAHSGVKWDGEKQGGLKSDNAYAYIPGFTELTFKSGTVHQSVNFYNPETNSAKATLTLKLSDGTVLWEEENVNPGYGFYDIEIKKTLSKGFYDASLTYSFFSDTGEKYNGGIVPFELIVI